MPMSTDTYHQTVQNVYRDAALTPASNLCCVPQRPQYLPGLVIPPIMHEMNYGCGSTVHPEDFTPNCTALYVGVGGGLEALQLAYFCRRPGGVIAVDPVAEMRQAAAKNLDLAAKENDWFDPSFVRIVDGDALNLPVDDDTIDLAAQNCLFNIFTADGDLQKALAEMHRVLTPGGRLSMSDPITPVPLPPHVKNNEQWRAECLSGCQLLDDYLNQMVDAGFGSIEVRKRTPYRMLDTVTYQLREPILLETIEVAAHKTQVPPDGACIFTGATAVYFGDQPQLDDGNGHVLQRNLPYPVCDKTAANLKALQRKDLVVTDPTWHYQGGGCC